MCIKITPLAVNWLVKSTASHLSMDTVQFQRKVESYVMFFFLKNSQLHIISVNSWVSLLCVCVGEPSSLSAKQNWFALTEIHPPSPPPHQSSSYTSISLLSYLLHYSAQSRFKLSWQLHFRSGISRLECNSGMY